MKIVEQGFTMRFPQTREQGMELVRSIAEAARTCYRTDDPGSYEKDAGLVRRLTVNGHEAMLEHGQISVRIVTDRGVSHELVRHRLASYAQESQRYCGYDKDKFGGEIEVIQPSGLLDRDSVEAWYIGASAAEDAYLMLRKHCVQPETARSVLPNCVKTEIIMTASPREWRHVFKLRALGLTGRPHPDMQRLMLDLLKEFNRLMPELFGDLVEFRKVEKWEDSQAI